MTRIRTLLPFPVDTGVKGAGQMFFLGIYKKIQLEIEKKI